MGIKPHASPVDFSHGRVRLLRAKRTPPPFVGRYSMAARANSSATISFGLVSIPVKVYTANRSKSVSFNMLHAKDKSRLKQQYVCATCSEPVESADRVKGFEYARDQYVVMNDEELKALERKSDRTIEIEEFIPMERVDALYYEKAQLLGPDKGGAKAYYDMLTGKEAKEKK